MRATGASRGPAREAAILAAAVELVDEVGYERVTCDAVAARARASKATLYRRWPGKAELVAEALRRQAQGDGRVQPPDTGGLRGDLLAAVAATNPGITGAGPGRASLLGLVEGLRDEPTLRELVRNQIEAASADVADTILSSARDRRELSADAPVLPVLRLAVGELLLTALLDGRPAGTQQQEHLVDAVLLPLLQTSAALAGQGGREHR